MYKAAVVTDLHLGSSNGPARMASFTRKVATLNGRANALFITGDTVGLAEERHWKALIGDRASQPVIIEMQSFCRGLAEKYFPDMLSAARSAQIENIFIIPGNGDSMAYNLLQTIDNGKDLFFIHKKQIFNVMGLGGIEPDNEEAGSITIHNPWYKGVMRPDEFLRELGSLALSLANIPPDLRSNTILMTHAPAFGHLDHFYGSESIGSKSVLSFINDNKPILHICGHVHSGCYEGENWDYKPFSVIGDHTVSVNPGGDMNHDYEEGVLMATVDVDGLVAAKREGRLAEAAPDLVKPVL